MKSKNSIIIILIILWSCWAFVGIISGILLERHIQNKFNIKTYSIFPEPKWLALSTIGPILPISFIFNSDNIYKIADHLSKCQTFEIIFEDETYIIQEQTMQFAIIIAKARRLKQYKNTKILKINRM